jgi:hypothetical protein
VELLIGKILELGEFRQKLKCLIALGACNLQRNPTKPYRQKMDLVDIARTFRQPATHLAQNFRQNDLLVYSLPTLKISPLFPSFATYNLNRS